MYNNNYNKVCIKYLTSKFILYNQECQISTFNPVFVFFYYLYNYTQIYLVILHQKWVLKV